MIGRPTLSVMLSVMPAGLLVAGLLIGCSTTSPPVQRYLFPLSVPEGTARLESPERTGIDSLTVAPYLRDPGIVIETEGRQVRAARFHRWAESLPAALRRFLQAEISQELGYDVAANPLQADRWQERVSIAIERFHGTLDGKAELTARWEIDAKDRAPLAFRFSKTRALAESGYAGLVDAEIELARDLARAIADSLRSGSTP